MMKVNLVMTGIISEVVYNSGHMATLRSAQIYLWETSYVRKLLGDISEVYQDV